MFQPAGSDPMTLNFSCLPALADLYYKEADFAEFVQGQVCNKQ